jgi:predicted enzyme related to lactoylglutathione lyase
MPERTSYAPGTPSWVDIGTDLEGAIPFYTGLFDWEAAPAGPPEETGGYGFFTKGGKSVAGYGPQTNPGPPFWSTYLSVADIEATGGTVQENGGTVVMPAMDVMTAGRMAVFQDPQGGIISAWQPGEHIGAQVVNEAGAFCWNELQTRDVEGSKAFYASVFGWEATTHEGGPFPYTEFALDGQPVAGMMPMPPMVPPEVPTYWLVYFAVESTDGSLTRAQELGATILTPPMDIPAGRFSVLQDPQHATFAIIQMPD